MPVKAAVTRSPSVMSALALIALMDITARVGGFGRAMALAQRLGAGERHISGDGNTNSRLTEETARKVIMAAAFYPRRALCLEQSLALFVLLRRRGIAADLKVGMQPLPFSAHAWVEVEGMPVNELPGHIEQLVTFQHVSV